MPRLGGSHFESTIILLLLILLLILFLPVIFILILLFSNVFASLILSRSLLMPDNRIHLCRPPAVKLMTNLGLKPDPWQVEVLEGNHTRLLLNCCRQAGKS